MKTCIAAVLLALPGLAVAQDVPLGYAGQGGMTLQEIDPAIYAYHYDHGFVGEDALGWDPALQFAWSRIAAAKVCAQQSPSDALIGKLVEQYGKDAMVHRINGIGFHEAQMRAAGTFCTPARVAEATAVAPAFAAGDFSKATAYAAAAEAGTLMVATQPTVISGGAGSAALSLPADWALLLPLHSRTVASSNGQPAGDEVLHVIRRIHTGANIAGQVIGNVMTAAILGRAGVIKFDKSQLKGEEVQRIGNPGYLIQRDAIKTQLKLYFTAKPGAMLIDPFPLQVAMSEWRLVYQSLSNDKSPYELRYQVSIGGESSSGFFKNKASPYSLACRPTPRTASLEEWEANDYALVKEAAQAYSDECASKFAERLPQWFPDREAVATN
ncbi:hypothetical protein ACU10_17655 [Xanthomonas oryzae pv. oryzicola]|uniref:hypothetical protein n=1 Tax=Xanthomonas oryzae TaxID=347 RepID=UPI000654FBA1|nr:hypothetical protein [Xanthomonas oryzae]AKN94579.1 hypothetical protein ACU13_17730 [Xanthomonas oryzae pv. oryzicola]AKN98302.1 hypothetical protein ACU10_17655 [Xanthomonas oryzae pv. oryzicola]AKO13527.1 hypothetical protein ACU14_17655 [Xanthomonas oryzae pv. oryzicola]AKO17270.1 hypothetical protein ACU12_17730 [Xanthomonas oryzae pv. oryzicola]